MLTDCFSSWLTLYFYSPLQLLTDYPLAFGALGLSGIFYEKKHGLLKGYIVGVLGRYIFAVISGVVFFGNYAPEGTPALVYSLGYNATYIVPEAVATMIIISIPAVSKAMSYVRSKGHLLKLEYRAGCDKIESDIRKDSTR